MKNKAQIEAEILFLEVKLEEALITGRGYGSYSEKRSDEGRIKTLQWVLEDD